MNYTFLMRVFLLGFLLTSLGSSTPLKLLVIGDSQSEEYAFEVPFSAPDSSPLQANTQNWIEILAEHRSTDLDFGSYANTLFSYLDLRNGGYEFNWGVPSAETETWADVVNASIFDDLLLVSTRTKLIDQLPEVDAIVIVLGGNDVNSEYRSLQNGSPPTNWQNNIISNLSTLIDFVQTWSSKPVILANAPDVGATQLVTQKFPDSTKRSVATEHIQQLNSAIATLAQTKGATLTNFFSITEQLTQPTPIRIGNIELFPFGNPENTPRHLLCKDGFHPSTATQCLLANLVLNSLNLAPLSDDEILSNILEISPSQDDIYLTWIRQSTQTDSLLADPDGDGLPNLGEYALNLNPVISDAPLFTFHPFTDRIPYVTTSPVASENLIDWLPASNVIESPDGSKTIPLIFPFARLEFKLTK